MTSVSKHLALIDDEDTGWMAYANCLGCDPELFFPTVGEPLRQAKAICAGCVVRDDCLEYALRHNEQFGIWGGVAARDRRRMRRRRVS